MKRLIITIHEELCNGCGLCLEACAEGAIELIDGKAKLVSDVYCDGLGACLPSCPTGALELLEREAESFDEAAVAARVSVHGGEVMGKEAVLGAASISVEQALADYVARGQRAFHRPQETIQNKPTSSMGCPGASAQHIRRDVPREREVDTPSPASSRDAQTGPASELQHWPIQISLVHPSAPFLRGANLLVAADCTAFAYGNFHREFIRGHTVLIGCPKLDDVPSYVQKLSQILEQNQLQSITVVRMSVPCCSGIVQAVKQAMLISQTIVPYREVTVGIDGELVGPSQL